jgi:hypothetical protein
METEKPKTAPMTGDGVGLKMLLAMGWRGGGLGTDEAGIVEPVKGEFHDQGENVKKYLYLLIITKTTKKWPCGQPDPRDWPPGGRIVMTP